MGGLCHFYATACGKTRQLAGNSALKRDKDVFRHSELYFRREALKLLNTYVLISSSSGGLDSLTRPNGQTSASQEIESSLWLNERIGTISRSTYYCTPFLLARDDTISWSLKGPGPLPTAPRSHPK